MLEFPVYPETYESLNNYDLYFMPNGIYRAKQVKADNYLFPMYAYRENGEFRVSTSVYALILYKKRFVRDPKFQTTFFYRPTFLTIDKEIQRVRTTHRRSTYELTDPQAIVRLGVECIQEYITQIEEMHPGCVHLVLMGGKDSQNLVLARRKAPWVVLSSEPNADLNERFIRDNNIDIACFVGIPNTVDVTLLTEEILASDCFFDVAHFRWFRVIHDLVNEYKGKVVLWMGTSGDGCFSRNGNHRDQDYYAVHDLHVGMSMGIWHQMYKNLFDIPAVSPYQSPRFLEDIFYKYDPYFVDRSGDVRPQVGKLLLGRDVQYPETNPTPAPWDSRSRFKSIGVYVDRLKKAGVSCRLRPLASGYVFLRERAYLLFDAHSAKKRSALSRVLHPLRKFLGRCLPGLRIRRHDMAATEIT